MGLIARGKGDIVRVLRKDSFVVEESPSVDTALTDIAAVLDLVKATVVGKVPFINHFHCVPYAIMHQKHT